MRLTRSAGLLASVAGATALGAAAASAIVTPQGLPEPVNLAPVPGTGRVDRSEPDPDPDGGPDWAVRLYESEAGAACVELGRTRGGRFGRLDADGRLQPLPLRGAGACANLAVDPLVLAVDRVAARGAQPARTILFGRAGARVVAVRVRRAGAVPARPALGSGGGFLLPLAGLLAPSQLPVSVTLSDGRVVAYDWR